MTNAKPGDIGIVEHPNMFDAHCIIRVVNVGKVMWDIQTWGRNWTTEEIGWCKPRKRKVKHFLPLPHDADIPATLEKMRAARDALWTAEAKAKADYYAAINALGEQAA